jgi:hypothetical protein
LENALRNLWWGRGKEEVENRNQIRRKIKIKI